jgi:predicted AAA+ superfamily ATPase
MLLRRLSLPPPGAETFFLWGPRLVGKTTLLRAAYPEAVWIDLLQSEQFRRYASQPERLREEVRARQGPAFVVIDEVQKVPALLEEVHWLHENTPTRFALCGSSARKVRRGHANLLGGRAVRRELSGLVSVEVGAAWDLDRMLAHGYLPSVYLAARPERLLNAYVADYLKEEIAAEGQVRSLPVFADFLAVAALSDTAPLNFSAIGRDCGVSYHTVRGYFEILADTLQGRWLPAYRRRPKRRVAVAPKFYFADVGVVNHLARRGTVLRGSDAYGQAFENWVHHELCAYNAYAERYAHLSFWRLSTGTEVDFIVDDLRVAIEAKASRRIVSDHLRGLRALQQDHPKVGRRLVVCLEETPRVTDDGIEIWPHDRFARQLWSGELL